MRVNLQPAFVIHRRPYRDSSSLLDVFTAEYGRINLVARGSRRQSRKGSSAAVLQPFTPLLVSFSGGLDLKTLTAVEPARRMPALHGDRLFSGLYMNELLVRLLHRNDAHPRLFASYSEAVEVLGGLTLVDSVLRRFELALLEELGYRLDLEVDRASGQRIQQSAWYRFEPGLGLVACDKGGDGAGLAVSGGDLLAMAAGEFGGTVRTAAKRLLREALAVHLGGEPLRSRELFGGAGIGRGAQ